MITLEDENMEAVYTHLKNVPLNQFSDFASLDFSKGSSSYDTLNTSEMEQNVKHKNVDNFENSSSDSKSECPFNEFEGD